MTPRPNTQAQIDAIKADMAALKKQVEADAKVRDENHVMLSALHQALMVPAPGQDGKSLLERMADVTVDIESGQRTATNMIAVARWLAAIAAALAALAAAVKFGQ
jgi:ribosome-interacting GTPase 1